MEALENTLAEFIKGDSNPKFIEIEEELEDESYTDEVDGSVKEKDASNRIQSGWYGQQDPGRLRMDPDITSKALQMKANCTEGDLKSHGVYKFTYLPTRDTYIGKAKEQSLEKRLLQHLNKAMSTRELTGDVDPLLRQHPHASNWHLIVEPLEKAQVDHAEAYYINLLQPSLNIQQPDP